MRHIMPKITARFRSDETRAQGEDVLGSSLSHPLYRALVVRTAGSRAGTKEFYLAQKKVDSALGRAGASLEIPGASPGRRTI